MINAKYFNEEGCNQSYWFCVQTRPKHEHIAAGHLNKAGGIEVFNPQLRIRRATKRGSVWFTESAFPRYIFVRFNLHAQLDTVRYSSGVTQVVHFNSVYPSVPDYQVAELNAIFGDNNLLVLTSQLTIGNTVRILSGAFHGLLAVVDFVHPAKQRVRVLLEFLGRITAMEVDGHNVMVEQSWQAPCCHPLCRT